MSTNQQAHRPSSLEGSEYAPRILVVDDEPEIIKNLVRALSGPPIHVSDTLFDVQGETELACVQSFIEKDEIDIYIVDLKLKESKHSHERKELGEQLIRKIAETTNAGLIVYSSEPVDQTIESLFDGADDYIAKGNSPTIIRARVSALWRRIKRTRPAFSQVYAHHNRSFQIGVWRFDITSRDLRNSEGRAIRISPIEHTLLSYMLTVEGHEIDRDHFSVYVLGRETHDTDRRIDNLISRLRKKLGDSVQFIANRTGGYKLLGASELPQA